MARDIELQCSPAILELLLEALDHYVAVSFPPGSTDCGQVAREELLNLVQGLRHQYGETGTARYSRRLRALVREGVRVHCEQLSQSDGLDRNRERALLQAAASGAITTDEDLQTARAGDRRAR